MKNDAIPILCNFKYTNLGYKHFNLINKWVALTGTFVKEKHSS